MREIIASIVTIGLLFAFGRILDLASTTFLAGACAGAVGTLILMSVCHRLGVKLFDEWY